jgi:hypothetical protein
LHRSRRAAACRPGFGNGIFTMMTELARSHGVAFEALPWLRGASSKRDETLAGATRGLGAQPAPEARS